jgi:2,3-bisphosphoglycerate-dependent phosphoglycerate mutase
MQKQDMALLVIVRHGQSQWNLENRFTGEVDIGLTQLGRQEAIQAGEKLKEIEFDRAFTSILKRAEETLELILEQSLYPKVVIERSKALNERNYGSLQGLNKAETAEKYGVQQVEIWRRSYEIAPPGGESLKDTAFRVIPYYQREIEPLIWKNQQLLIVAHGNSLRALMMYLENISEEDIEKINIPTSTPRLYNFDQHFKIEKTAYL